MDITAVLPPGLRVIEVLPRTGGELSTVYEVRSADAEPLVVKCYRDEWRWKQAKEVHLYGLLAAHGVTSAPSVVRVDAERAATVLTLVPGMPLSEANVEPAALPVVWRQVGELHAAVHRIAQPAFGYLTTEILDPEPDNTAYMRRRFAGKLAEFTELGGARDLHDGVRDRAAEQDGLFASCTAPTLCHNDLHEGNVLVEHTGSGWRVTGFVDVENAIAADPLVDLAKTVQYELTRSPVKFAGLLDGYGPLPADGLARLALYRLYHAVELWTWFASIGNTLPLASIGEDIRDLLSA